MNLSHIPECPGVYRIIDTAANQAYIGSSLTNCRQRVSAHFYALWRDDHDCISLQECFDSHGEEVFAVEMLEVCISEIARERERFWICTTDPELNKRLIDPVIGRGDFAGADGYEKCIAHWKGVGIHAMEEANGYARRARKRFNVQIPLPFPTLDESA